MGGLPSQHGKVCDIHANSLRSSTADLQAKVLRVFLVDYHFERLSILQAFLQKLRGVFRKVV